MRDTQSFETNNRPLRGRRARSIIGFAFASLVMGIIVNIAVAWGCALFIDPTHVDGDRSEGIDAYDTEMWFLAKVERPALTWIKSSRTAMIQWRAGRPHQRGFSDPLERRFDSPITLAPRWGNAATPSSSYLEYVSLLPDFKLVREERIIIGCGWPTLAMWCDVYYKLDTPSETTFEGTRGAIKTGLSNWYPSPHYSRVLPMRPIWGGFMVNALFFAVLFASPFIANFCITRLIRWLREQCPKCGYPKGNSALCTECGTALIRSATEEDG